MSNNKVYFIQAVENIKGVCLMDTYKEYGKNMNRCLIEDFWGDKFQFFCEGRKLERDLMEENIKELEGEK